ncbi:MAG: hypothetical protein KUL86_03075 [Castellaniella sp.]|nr:hypothetical protein [Castellaniella sp.]
MLLAVAGISGCATNWQHSSITDAGLADRQLKLDDAYCLQVAYGIAPMPPIPIAPMNTTSYVSGQIRTYDTSTGNTSSGFYSGSVTTSPANSFASGFSNGLALGAAVQARRVQDEIHDACMMRRGWKEVPFGASHAASAKPVPTAAPMVTSTTQGASTGGNTPARSSDAIYPNAQDAWLAEVNEFMVIYPRYKESPPLWGRLDAAVRKIAEEQPLASGPQILLAAHDSLNSKGEGVPEPAKGDPTWLIATIYRQAVNGSVADQNALGIGFMSGKNPFPRDYQRSRYWFQKSASTGDPTGQVGYGTLIFEGKGGAADRSRGYWWVEKAAATGDKSATAMLAVMKTKMSAAELRASE